MADQAAPLVQNETSPEGPGTGAGAGASAGAKAKAKAGASAGTSAGAGTPQSPPAQQEMKAPTEEDMKDIGEWSVQQVQEFWANRGFAEHAEVWKEHDITGDRLISLSPDDVRDLGITSIGDRMGISKDLEDMKKVYRKMMRNQKIVEHYQAFDGSALQLCIATGCGCFPRDPDKYLLTKSGLRLDEYDIPRICGIWKCMCWGGNLHVDNIALDQVRDVDTMVTKSGFCCFAVNKSHVIVAAGAGNDAESDLSRVVQKDMCLEAEEGDEFANAIFMAVEEYKASFRSSAKQTRV